MSSRFSGLNADYELEANEPIASGRLTDIFLARKSGSEEVLALKRFRNYLYPESLEGFYREVSSLSTLSHENILSIIDYSDEQVADNAKFIVLPYMRRGNLRSLLNARAFCPLSAVAPVLRNIATGIDYAHASGIIHGDIKPENVLLDTDGTAKVADFGVARHFDVEDSVTNTIPVSKNQIGSSAYLSPEQLSANATSPASDLYAFALVTYELLTGRLPFDVRAPLYEQLVARVQGNLMHPKAANSHLTDNVAEALLRGLHHKRDRRPATALGFVHMLERDTKWDIFLAHAGDDVQVAEEIFELLEPHSRVFLDSRRIRPGDDWDSVLQEAQRNSLVTVVLVSRNVGKAFYQREEIAAAINLARQHPESHRVVPLYLDEASTLQPPYGLSLKHGLRLGVDGDLKTLSQRLIALLSGLDNQ